MRIDGTDASMIGLVIIWGTAFPSLKILGDTLDPFEIMWFRYVPFLAVFGVWLIVKHRQTLMSLDLAEWRRFAAMAALGVAGYHVPVNIALRPETGVSAATGAILVATTPLWTLFAGALLGSEVLTRQRVLGSIVAFTGVIIVVLLGRGEAELTVALQASLILVAAILWSGYNLLAKPVIARHGGLFVTGLAFCLGTLYLAPYGLIVGGEPLTALDRTGWFWIVYLGVLATVLGYVIWNNALSKRRPSEVTAYIYGVPVVAGIAGWIILDEAITPWIAFGGLLVIAGVVIVQRARDVPTDATTDGSGDAAS